MRTAIYSVGGIAAAALFFSMPAAASLIIDDFSISQFVSVSTNNGTAKSSLTSSTLFVDTVTSSSVVTADREILARLSTAATNSRSVSLSSGQSGTYLLLDTQTESNPRGTGVGQLIYEKASTIDSIVTSFGTAPDVFGLGLNFGQFGNQFEIRGVAEGIASTATVPVLVTIYGAQSNTSASAQFDLTSTLATLQIAFASFTGDQSVFSNVGAIQVLLGTASTSPSPGTFADIRLDYLSVSGSPVRAAVPEPGTSALLGAGLVGIAMAVRGRKAA